MTTNTTELTASVVGNTAAARFANVEILRAIIDLGKRKINQIVTGDIALHDVVLGVEVTEPHDGDTGHIVSRHQIPGDKIPRPASHGDSQTKCTIGNLGRSLVVIVGDDIAHDVGLPLGRQFFGALGVGRYPDSIP